MKKGSISVIFGCLFTLFGLLGVFLHSEPSLYLFIIPIGVMMIISGIFLNRGYYNKTYYLAFLGMIVSLGLILIYNYIFTPDVFAGDKVSFYFKTGIFIVFAILFIYYYPRRKKNLKMPWRDKWRI